MCFHASHNETRDLRQTMRRAKANRKQVVFYKVVDSNRKPFIFSGKPYKKGTVVKARKGKKGFAKPADKAVGSTKMHAGIYVYTDIRTAMDVRNYSDSRIIVEVTSFPSYLIGVGDGMACFKQVKVLT